MNADVRRVPHCRGPDIVDAAVIGVPDDRYGEALLAFIVTAGNRALAVEEVVAFCRQRQGAQARAARAVLGG